MRSPSETLATVFLMYEAVGVIMTLTGTCLLVPGEAGSFRRDWKVVCYHDSTEGAEVIRHWNENSISKSEKQRNWQLLHLVHKVPYCVRQ